mgnify:CR=1 FL=1
MWRVSFGIATVSSGPTTVEERPPWTLLVIALDVLGWMRAEPLISFMATALIVLAVWMRQAAHRPEQRPGLVR